MTYRPAPRLPTSALTLLVFLAVCGCAPAPETANMGQAPPAADDPSPLPGDKDLAAAWDDLAADDAPRAYRAVVCLAHHPQQSVPFLKARLRPASGPGAREVARLVAALGAENFADRERAEQELEALGEAVRPALERAAAGAPEPEVRRRLEALLERLERRVPPPGELREVRAVEALERMATPEARELLRALSEGAKETRVTQEAKASLDRLTRSTATNP